MILAHVEKHSPLKVFKQIKYTYIILLIFGVSYCNKTQNVTAKKQTPTRPRQSPWTNQDKKNTQSKTPDLTQGARPLVS